MRHMVLECLGRKLCLNLLPKDVCLLALIAMASVGFTSIGAVIPAPYWLFDGITFFVSGFLVFEVLRRAGALPPPDGGGQSERDRDVSVGPASNTAVDTIDKKDLFRRISKIRSAALVVCCFCALCLVTELGFFSAAVILFDDEMNPWARSSNGSRGSSFVLCSICSAALNFGILLRMWVLRNSTRIPCQDTVDSPVRR